MSTTHGGSRKGSGRKPVGTKLVGIRLTPEKHDLLNRLGGSKWIDQKLGKIMNTVEKTIESVFHSISPKVSEVEKYTTAYWMLTDIQQILRLGITSDEAKIAADEVRRMAQPIISNRAKLAFSCLKSECPDIWRRHLLPEAGTLMNKIEVADRDAGWWSEDVCARLADLVSNEWASVCDKPRYEFRHNGLKYVLEEGTFGHWCWYYSGDKAPDGVLLFDNLEDVGRHIKTLADRGLITEKNINEIRKEFPDLIAEK